MNSGAYLMMAPQEDVWLAKAKVLGDYQGHLVARLDSSGDFHKELLAQWRHKYGHERSWGCVPLSICPRAVFMDFDGTTIQQESLVEMARLVGLEKDIDLLTDQAMQGGMDFATSLNMRLHLMKGQSAKLQEEVLPFLHLQKGMEGFCHFVKQDLQAQLFAVSGGFLPILEAFLPRLGLDGVHAHKLEVQYGLLSGKVASPLVDAFEKKDYLLRTACRLGIDRQDIICLGDGANDLEMMQCAGLRVGVAAKKVLWPHLDVYLHQPDIGLVTLLLEIAVQQQKNDR